MRAFHRRETAIALACIHRSIVDDSAPRAPLIVDRPGTLRVIPSGPGRSARSAVHGVEAPRESVDPGLVEPPATAADPRAIDVEIEPALIQARVRRRGRLVADGRSRDGVRDPRARGMDVEA